MQKQIKPIETFYKGYRFRSRLEARWAVFFDSLSIEWEYEKEGYDIDGMWYLPDFWLPQIKIWAEVKPYKFSDDEEVKFTKLCEATKHSGVALEGLPAVKAYRLCEYIDGEDSFNLQGKSFMYSYPTVCFTNQGDSNASVWFWVVGDEECAFEDTINAVIKAKQARFEHGEN